jgi:hypothetical protein
MRGKFRELRDMMQGLYYREMNLVIIYLKFPLLMRVLQFLFVGTKVPDEGVWRIYSPDLKVGAIELDLLELCRLNCPESVSGQICLPADFSSGNSNLTKFLGL